MKNSIFFLLLALPLLASASAQTTIDLQKFASKAKFSITTAFGKENALPDSGRVFWVDGIGNNEDVAPDLSSLNYIMEIKSGIRDIPNHLVAYRLSLGGGRLELRMLNDVNGYAAYSVPASYNLTFIEMATAETLESIKNDILLIDPKASVQLFSFIKVMNVACSPAHYSQLQRYLMTNPFIASASPNQEGYSMDARILPMRLVDAKGKLDLETLREVSKNHELYPKAFVPLKLR